MSCEVLSGQQHVSLEKSEVFFSAKIIGENKAGILQALDMREMYEHKKYIGLPMCIGKCKKVIFELIKQRIWNRASGWKE